jgi:hypothetical protein
MYTASVPVLERALSNLRVILEKGAAHAAAKKIEPSVLLNARLFPDMFPLSRQVQIAADMAKGCAGRLAGLEIPKFEDTESTFPELIARLDKTIAFVKTATPEQVNGTEEKTVTLPSRNGTMEFKGLSYLFNFVLPNVHFHATTTYDILRHNGVELGKSDYIGAL